MTLSAWVSVIACCLAIFFACIALYYNRKTRELVRSRDQQPADVGTEQPEEEKVNEYVWHIRTLKLEYARDDMVEMHKHGWSTDLNDHVDARRINFVRELIEEGLSVGNVTLYENHDIDLDKYIIHIEAHCIRALSSQDEVNDGKERS